MRRPSAPPIVQSRSPTTSTPAAGPGLVLRREVEQLVAPRDHDVERLVARRQRRPRRRAEPARPSGSVHAATRWVPLGVVDDAQVEPVAIDDAAARCPVAPGSLISAGGRDDGSCPRVSPVDEVGPVHVGQPEMVDVGVHGRHHEVASEDRPVVPPLVPPEAALAGSPGAAVPWTTHAPRG